MNAAAWRTRLDAPAKINLTLEVVGKLPNGYHAIRSVFARLDRLADRVEVEVSGGARGIEISCDSAAIPLDAANICHQAAARYLEQVGCGRRVRIHIEKRIPVAAGLGGGSSDAAAVLHALDLHFGQCVGAPGLLAIGNAVGSDVAFFLARAPCAHVSGRGDIVQPLGALPPLHFLIVNPGIAVSTARAYGALAQQLWFMADATRANVSEHMARAIAAGQVPAICAALCNDFEGLVEAWHPVVKEIKQALRAFGAAGALMSGSGPTVFGLFESAAVMQHAQRAIGLQYPSFLVCAA